METCGLSNAKALAIFYDLKNPGYTPEEKGTAIFMICNLETHNGFRKKDIAAAIRWILQDVMCYSIVALIRPYRARQYASQIRSAGTPTDVKILAVISVICHRTFAEMSRDQLLDILRWCWEQCFEWNDDREGELP